ncbi:ShlB/FhaC/HecB family hemolysin secretion/activation protein [Brenneria goodwinii]|nr:ShlB/FhaC/HecB family hemolysin secretion/activation protein [Brenneria goodwinii]MCG8162329.1 ShlB/FhaC/HecB family hemolysin secretion/activation protein [Brenneria goodwinii]MCG8166950.1 ShlB/FhaC/HecB family hemolysin secretion/activation protein [Brenneria goodwinii]MCG8169624.1 ShlB/FhaC/HecB family hemolysin secretion/activation protein [Brenneria goodwinii]MCG8174770.1 ShlB/FhaC/HecB family hemolysin secretion/activation protein [Brenneria goodwinii]
MCKYRTLLGLLLLFVVSPSLAIDDVTPADRNTLELRQKALLEQNKQQRKALENAVQIGEPAALPVNADGPCFPIHNIAFNGAVHLSSHDKSALQQRYQDRCLDLAAISNAVRETTNLYLSRGYLTSQAYLQEQDLASGTLTISVSEGRLESIQLEGETPLALNMAFPGLTGRILNLRDLEQGMEQLNRLPSQQITIDIQPGKQPGSSIAVLRRTTRALPVELSISADNSGQKSTGREQLSASLAFDNPLRLADRWWLTASRDSAFSHRYGSHALSSGLSLPYGYWTLAYQYAWNDFFQPIPIGNNAYRYTGQSATHRLSINNTLYRDGKQKLALEGALNRRRTENRLAGERLDVSSPTLSSVSGGLNYSATLAGGYFTLNPIASHGLHAWGATDETGTHHGTPRVAFRKFSLSGSYFYPLTPSLYFLTSAYGQTTPDNLYSSERISLGGEYSVRGFKEQTLTGNRGLYWRNELNWQFAALPLLGNLAFTAALDSGWISGKAGKVDGASLGLSAASHWTNQSISLGVPLHFPHELHPDNAVLYWQVNLPVSAFFR